MRSSRSTPIRVAVTAALLLASATLYAQGAAPAPPGASGVETRLFTSNTQLVGNTSLHFTLDLPTGWLAHHDGTSTLFEPSTAPTGDLGALVLLEERSHSDHPLDTPEAVLSLLADGLLVEPRELARETLTLKVDGQPLEATLLAVEARFDNGRPARFFVVHALHRELALIALAGADDDHFAPWDATLRDLVTSVSLRSGPAPSR